MFLFALAAPLSRAATLPANTPLEVRLCNPSGSRISHVGDLVKAVVIAPVFQDGQLLVPQGSVISGDVQAVGRLGYGLKHVTSEIQYRFHTLQLPDGTNLPIKAAVKQVETAKERVNADGVVGGIYPTANLSSSLAPYVIPLLCIDPHFGLPFLGIKVIIARSPDPEIYFPAGTELILRVSSDTPVPFREAESPVQRLSAADVAEVHQILAKLPQQRTNRGRNHPSDLVNILLLGDRDAVNRAFHAAGWAGAQRSSLMSIFGMYHCMVQRMGYSMAPMGQLTLNGARADAAFQKSLNTFSKRHHVRLWKQAGSEAWLSSATEDIGYVVRDMHLTHATDPAIDNERNKVLNDLTFTGCVEAASLVTRAPVEQSETSIQTDGRIAVLRVNECQSPRAFASDDSEFSARPKSRSVQALIALRNDLLRTNPVFLTFNTAKLLCARWQSRAAAPNTGLAFRLNQPNAGAAKITATGWVRPSVLGAEPHAN